MVNFSGISINYTEREKELSNYLFNTFRSPHSEYMEGLQFAELMRKSNLTKVEEIINPHFILIGSFEEYLGNLVDKKSEESDFRGIPGILQISFLGSTW